MQGWKTRGLGSLSEHHLKHVTFFFFSALIQTGFPGRQGGAGGAAALDTVGRASGSGSLVTFLKVLASMAGKPCVAWIGELDTHCWGTSLLLGAGNWYGILLSWSGVERRGTSCKRSQHWRGHSGKRVGSGDRLVINGF